MKPGALAIAAAFAAGLSIGAMAFTVLWSFDIADLPPGDRFRMTRFSPKPVVIAAERPPQDAGRSPPTSPDQRPFVAGDEAPVSVVLLAPMATPRVEAIPPVFAPPDPPEDTQRSPTASVDVAGRPFVAGDEAPAAIVLPPPVMTPRVEAIPPVFAPPDPPEDAARLQPTSILAMDGPMAAGEEQATRLAARALPPQLDIPAREVSAQDLLEPAPRPPATDSVPEPIADPPTPSLRSPGEPAPLADRTETTATIPRSSEMPPAGGGLQTPPMKVPRAAPRLSLPEVAPAHPRARRPPIFVLRGAPPVEGRFWPFVRPDAKIIQVPSSRR